MWVMTIRVCRKRGRGGVEENIGVTPNGIPVDKIAITYMVVQGHS